MEVGSNDKLEEILELTKENNRILHSLRGAQRRASAFRLLYWLVIIGLGFGAFYYIQPYLEQIMSVYSGAQDSIANIQNASASIGNGDWKSILDSYKSATE